MVSMISLQNLLKEFPDAVEVVDRNAVRLKVHNHFLGVNKTENGYQPIPYLICFKNEND